MSARGRPSFARRMLGLLAKLLRAILLGSAIGHAAPQPRPPPPRQTTEQVAERR